MFVLTVLKGPDEGQRFKLEPGRTYSVGCNAEADIVLTDPMVLKGHCSLEIADDSVIVRNHTASAGTFVGGKKISQARIKGNAPIRLGDTVLTLQQGRPERRPEGRPEDRPATRQAPERTEQQAAAAAKAKLRPQARDLTGKIVGGYKLNEVVGRGGMGTVYRATQLSLQRDVALKILSRDLAKDPGFRSLFINEAQAAAQLVHPNVVQVYDAGTEGDVSYFSMEFIGQGSVEELLGRDKQIPWPDAILMILEAAHGLQFAEAKGIVHRDIKPDNLMLDDEGRIKIADLGLAKRGAGSDDTGVIGTPHFIPPEQALGTNVDGRADQYSLGATFFRMITGKTVFTGRTAKEIVLKHVNEPPPAASSAESDVPGDLDLVLAKMLAKDPEDRYSDSGELIGALEEVCANHGIKGAIIKKGVGKRVLIPLVLLLLVGGVVIFKLATKEGPTRDNPEAIRLREEAERKQQKAERAAREAKRGQLRAQAKGERANLRAVKATLQARNPIKSVFDDKATAEANTQDWLDLKLEFEEAEQGDLFGEFEEELGLVTWAKAQAKDIEVKLRKGQASAEVKRQKIALKKGEANGIVKTVNEKLVKLRAEKRFENALNLAEAASTDRYPKDDPFRPLLDSEITYGDERDKVADLPSIMKIVKPARRDFAKEYDRIVLAFRNDWERVREQAEKLPDTAAEADIQKAIEDLEAVVETYIDPKARPKDNVRKAQREAKKLVGKWKRDLENFKKGRLAKDLALIARTLRTQSSLDPDINPNNVMFCRPKDAILQWTKTLQGLQTPRYKAFAQERIELLSWYEYAFKRFNTDLNASFGGPKGARPFASLKISVPIAGQKVFKTALAKHKSNPQAIYQFTTRAKVRGLSKRDHAFSSFPMNWIYHGVFYEGPVLRWKFKSKDEEALIRFALGAFCFETMQYDAAREEFGKVVALNNKRHGPAASILMQRATHEAQAQADWMEICRDSLNPKDLAAVKAIAARVMAFRTKHARTIFYIEVKSKSWPMLEDFYDEAKAPALPDAPDG